jgi:hypothetical protein
VLRMADIVVVGRRRRRARRREREGHQSPRAGRSRRLSRHPR